MATDHKLKLAVNQKLIDKNLAGDDALFAVGWKNIEARPAELAEYINAGVAYCPQLTGARRNAKNFLCSDVISVDVDGTRRIPDILEDPLIKQCLTILYTTPNHTEERHRFRLIFALARTITSAPDMRAASLSLTLRVSGDRSATDAARLFYGSRGSNPQLFDGFIPEALLDELIEEGKRANQPDTYKSGAQAATTVSRQTIGQDQTIQTDQGEMLPLAELAIGTRVHCPFHFDEDPSAFVLKSRSGTKGLHCSTCAMTFWPAGSRPPAYDFFDFDRKVKAAHAYFLVHQDPEGLLHFATEEASIHPGLHQSNIRVINSPYIEIPELLPGITFVKSPKGTGKTETLARLVADKKKRVLLIGHRVALIGQSCNRLGLNSYLDYGSKGHIVDQRLGICLDSLQRLSWTERHNQKSATKYNEFETIIIDESEQVLSHFLSDTIDREDRTRIFLLFRRLLRQAQSVVALDADLGWLTFETLTKLVNKDPGLVRDSRFFRTKEGESNVRPCTIYLNEYTTPKTLLLFNSEQQLTADVMQSLADGKRVFVTSNSKLRMRNLGELIETEFEGRVKTIVVTSETNTDPEVKRLVQDVRNEALKYQAILTSPTLGTGVDIAFDGNEQKIDVVYGFFQHLITTHFDFDQQLARVRHPGAVKVWLTPFRYEFDTGTDVIKKELQERETYTNLLMDFDEHLKPVFHTDDEFTDLAALVVSQQRASKNDLKKHFLELKRHQAFEVAIQPQDNQAIGIGQSFMEKAKKLGRAKLVTMLTEASPLKKPEFEALIERIEERDEVSELERWALERTMIELFYRKPITPNLPALDDNGRFRRKMRLFEDLLVRWKSVSRASSPDWNRIDIAKAPEFRFLRDAGHAASLLDHLLGLAPLRCDGHIDLNVKFTLEQLVAFSLEAKRLKPVIENILDIHVRSDVDKKPMMLLAQVLDLIGLGLEKPERRRQSGKTIYYYPLDRGKVHLMHETAKRRKECDGWETLYRMHGWDEGELRDDEWIAPSNATKLTYSELIASLGGAS